MSKLIIERVLPGNLFQIFVKNLNNPNTYFVFSTDTVMNSWIDWCIKNPELSGSEAVALERFMAWDTFKSEFVSGKELNKQAIPSILRKFFIMDLIQKNASSHFFGKLISPEYAESAEGFCDWLTAILPSLKLWKSRYEIFLNNNNLTPQMDSDLENKDFYFLYKSYTEFLDNNNLFEPNWVDPEFSDSNKKFILIYPEILEDYCEYIDVFSKCSNVQIISLPEELPENIPCYKYSDARKELRRTILQIRQIVESKKAQWNDICLNVPDLDLYRPYLERELSNYCVPYVIHGGQNLVKSSAGQIFQEIYDCYSSNFSYDSVRTLLLDEHLPWKTENKFFEDSQTSFNLNQAKENLIREGNRFRCLISYEENFENKSVLIDTWEKALKNEPKDFAELSLYKQLKNDIRSICNANSFEGIQKAWIIFKKNFLDDNNFDSEENKIISRCIVELNSLISISRDYCEKLGLSIKNPYAFFLNIIKNKTYTAQNPAIGLNIFPYRLSSGGNFKYQFIIDANQNNLEVQYKRLKFLNNEKRAALGLVEEDKKFNASKQFILLYGINNGTWEKNNYVQFSYGEESFSGFAIAHNYLKTEKIENPLKELDKTDFILAEKNLFLHKDKETVKQTGLSLAQKMQYKTWKEKNNIDIIDYNSSSKLKNQIDFVLRENREKYVPDFKKNGKIFISQSDMKNFFPCPRKWIFSSVFHLKDDSLDASLMEIYDMGNINHKILEHFMKYCAGLEDKDGNSIKQAENKIYSLPKINSQQIFENEEEIQQLVKNFTNITIHDLNFDYAKSPLVIAMLESQSSEISGTILSFLRVFCENYAGFQIHGIEKSYQQINTEESYNLYGKIDCLMTSGINDQDNLGFTLVDYKNSESAMPSLKSIYPNDDGLLEDFQMPMYVKLIQANNKVKDIDSASFFAIKTGKENNAFGKKKSFIDFEEALSIFQDYLNCFANKVYQGDFEPKTSTNIKDKFNTVPFTDCAECNFKAICRYNFTVAGKKINKRD